MTDGPEPAGDVLAEVLGDGVFEAAIERVRALCGDARAVWDEEPDAWRSGGVPEPIVAVVDALSAIDLEAP